MCYDLILNKVGTVSSVCSPTWLQRLLQDITKDIWMLHVECSLVLSHLKIHVRRTPKYICKI
jgi:hypothetical protein